MKALGTGTKGVSWREVEVQRLESGQPHLSLKGRASDRATKLGIVSLAISLSHSREYAVASVIGELQ